MRSFYTTDKRIMNWLSVWISLGPSPMNRGVFAAQLRLIRKKHGTPLATKYRNHILYTGSYPARGVYA